MRLGSLLRSLCVRPLACGSILVALEDLRELSSAAAVCKHWKRSAVGVPAHWSLLPSVVDVRVLHPRGAATTACNAPRPAPIAPRTASSLALA